MADEPTTGAGGRPSADTIASTGPGIPDDALAPGEELLVPPSDEEIAAMARRLGAPIPLAADAE